MKRLPCPEWCVTDHARMEDAELWADLREHYSADARVPTVAYDGGDHLTDTVSVSVCQTDNPTTGERDHAGVWLEANAETLSPERAVEFARAILGAARLASGVRPNVAGDCGTTDRAYAAKAVLHSLSISWPKAGGEAA